MLRPCIVLLTLLSTAELRAWGGAEVSSTIGATTPAATAAPAAGAAPAAATPVAASGSTKVNLTLNVEGVKLGLDGLSVNLTGLRLGIEKLTLIAEVTLPPLLPQAGELLGGATKLVGPATSAASGLVGGATNNLVGPATKAVTGLQ